MDFCNFESFELLKMHSRIFGVFWYIYIDVLSVSMRFSVIVCIYEHIKNILGDFYDFLVISEFRKLFVVLNWSGNMILLISGRGPGRQSVKIDRFAREAQGTLGPNISTWPESARGVLELLSLPLT